LDDRVRLVVVLAVGRQLEPARAELSDALRQATPGARRRLRNGALSDLLALAAELEVPFPDPRLQTLAVSLLPPARRP
jgi:hypothetical protein